MDFVRARKRIGLVLMASSLAIGALAAPAAVAAEGDGQVPEGLQEVEIARQAYWNADQSKYADNAATSEFPPQAVCLVQPDACFFPEGDQDPSSDLPTGDLDPFAEEDEETNDGLGALGNSASGEIAEQEAALLAQIAEADSGDEPADAVPPGSHPVSVAFGQANYRAAIEFALPEVPEGEQVASFHMVLTQGNPTYYNESPAFRQAVLAALTCASETEEGAFGETIGRCSESEFQKIDPSELSDTESPLLVEVCPIVGEWEEGQAKDEDDLPEVDCLYTTSGTPLEDSDGDIVWVFDLEFMAKAWYDGTLEQNGVLLRPGGAENFAFGDPETTYSKQVTFDQPVQVAMATEPEPEPFQPATPSTPPPSTSGGTQGGSGSGDVFATPPQPSSSGGSVPPPTTSTPSQPAEQPAVSAPVEEPAPDADTSQPQTLAAGTPLGQPESPWWLWLLIPVFLGGAWLMSRALEEEAVAATERSGAMTRLLQRQEALRANESQLVTG